MALSLYEYTCRRCAGVFQLGGADAEQARQQLMDLLRGERLTPVERLLHTCPDGGVGISDLIGACAPQAMGEES